MEFLLYLYYVPEIQSDLYVLKCLVDKTIGLQKGNDSKGCQPVKSQSRMTHRLRLSWPRQLCEQSTVFLSYINTETMMEGATDTC